MDTGTPDTSARITPYSTEAVDMIEVERLRRIIAAHSPASVLLQMPNEVLLEQLNVIAPGTDLRMTLAGLILVGREEYLRTELPGHEVTYLHLQSDTEYDRRFDSRRPLLAMLEQLHQAIVSLNRIFTLKAGLFHFEIPDFPEEVVREALLNALVHRDFTLLRPVFVRHYADRIEISSPGGFYGGITTENIIGHEPVSRNRLLAEILQRLGLVERAGMGVRRMFHILLSYGKEPPSFEAGSDFVRVTIRSGRAAAGSGIDEPFAAFVARQQQEGRELGLYELLILNWLKRNREIDIGDARNLLQRSETDAREVLNQMSVRGLLEPFGHKKGRVYRLSKAVYSRLRTSVSYPLFRRAEAQFAEAAIMDYLKSLGGQESERFVTNEIVRTLLRVSPDQATYLLGSMTKKGVLVLRGRGRGARYYATRQLSAF
ncbi:MAG: ATP-binding protein [candidate division WOR-3 bacterium]